MADKTLSGNALENLAARVEAATGPDRELDELADIHLGHVIEAPTTPRRRANWPQRISGLTVPRYTSSLDAAMTLAEGQEWCGGAGGLLREAMGRMSYLPAMVSLMSPSEYASTLARFFTAASLRARAAQEKARAKEGEE